MVFPYKTEADIKVHTWSWRMKKKNVNKHAARETGYANRDIQSGITLDRKIIFIYCKRLFVTF